MLTLFELAGSPRRTRQRPLGRRSTAPNCRRPLLLIAFVLPFVRPAVPATVAYVRRTAWCRLVRRAVWCRVVEDAHGFGEAFEDGAGVGELAEGLAEERLGPRRAEGGEPLGEVGGGDAGLLAFAAGARARYGRRSRAGRAPSGARLSGRPRTASSSTMGSRPFIPASGVWRPASKSGGGGVKKNPMGRSKPAGQGEQVVGGELLDPAHAPRGALEGGEAGDG